MISRPSDTLAITALIVGLCCSYSSHAGMRCGNELITEGDSVHVMITKCGQPQQTGQSIIYINKDGDGMNYYIHLQANGTIDNIQFSRGGVQ